MSRTIDVKWTADVFDAEEAKRQQLDGETIWTVCASGDNWYIVPRISISDVMGYIVVPDEIDV